MLLVGAFTGMVMSLQSVFAFRTFSLEAYAGGVTAKALSTELSPVLTALMLAGRAGAGIATELGTMRITEQIDALESMAVNPIQYPGAAAGRRRLPGRRPSCPCSRSSSAWPAPTSSRSSSRASTTASTSPTSAQILELSDVIQGVIKAAVFGMVVVLIGCYQGYHASGGGRGVGLGTTRAVVFASVSVLVLDYFLSDLLLSILGGK